MDWIGSNTPICSGYIIGLLNGLYISDNPNLIQT